jgi:tetratricopeptide (TPR) repeat protein
MIVAGVLLVPLLLPASNNENTENGQNVSAEPTTSEGIGLQSLGWRVQYWRSTVELLRHTPEVPFSNDKLHCLRKLIGYGPETFIVTFQQVFPEKLKSDYTYRSLLVDRPHNDYLYLAASVGLLGLMSFLAVLGVFFYLCYRYLRKARDDIDKLLLVAMVAAVVQYMADIFFNLSTISPELVFWLTLALMPVIGGFASDGSKFSSKTGQETSNDISRAKLISACICGIALIIVGLGIAARPFAADIYYERGQRLQGQLNVEAVDAYETATQIDPAEANYWHALGAYADYLAGGIKEERLRSQVLEMALSAYGGALDSRPYVAYEYYSMADVLTYWAWAGYTEKWAEATVLYEKAARLFPGNAVILDKWSLALILKGDIDEAAVRLDQALSADPLWAQTYYLSGLLRDQEGNKDDAGFKMTHPIKENPANLEYFIDFCFDLSAYNMVRTMNEALNEYLDEAPDDWAAQAMLGITDLFTGNVEQSIQELNGAVASAPDSDVYSLLQAILRLSKVNPSFKAQLSGVADSWRDKTEKNPDRDLLLPLIDQLTDAAR